MRIVEEINYSIDDIIDSINDELGFAYIKTTDSKGYINLGQGIKINIEFNEAERKLDKFELSFPRKDVDMTNSCTTAELYSSSIESAVQVIDLIKIKLGGVSDENT